MGSLRGGDGDGRPSPDNGGLPDLPPEWGTVVVPDDLTELDREATALRRERRRTSRRARWRHRFGLPPLPDDADNPPIGVPLMVMSIAIIAALTSLFAITLTTRSPTTIPATAPATVAATTTVRMIDLSLTDSHDKSVRLREQLPAVILLLDGCSCGPLITGVAEAVPANVKVLAVDRTLPIIPAGVTAIALVDPEQALLATYAIADRGATPAKNPTAVFVAADGTVTATIGPVLTATQLEPSIAKLAPR